VNFFHNKDVNTDSWGYKSAKFLRDAVGLDNTCFFKIGWSPDDVLEKLLENLDFPNEKLDYVFIDAEHKTECAIKDINAIKSYLAEKFIIFLHDVHCLGGINEYLMKEFGMKYTKAEGCEYPSGKGYNLAYIINLF